MIFLGKTHAHSEKCGEIMEVLVRVESIRYSPEEFSKTLDLDTPLLLRLFRSHDADSVAENEIDAPFDHIVIHLVPAFQNIDELKMEIDLDPCLEEHSYLIGRDIMNHHGDTVDLANVHQMQNRFRCLTDTIIISSDDKLLSDFWVHMDTAVKYNSSTSFGYRIILSYIPLFFFLAFEIFFESTDLITENGGCLEIERFHGGLHLFPLQTDELLRILGENFFIE